MKQASECMGGKEGQTVSARGCSYSYGGRLGQKQVRIVMLGLEELMCVHALSHV